MTEKEERIRRTNSMICSHNFMLVKSETVTNLYKCSWCGMKKRENKK